MRSFFLAAFIFCAVGTTAFAEESPLFAREGVAIDGYDPVAYFTLGRAVRGQERHEYEWQGVRWRFSSAENRQLFVLDPEAYAPQYGGYCAWGLAARNKLHRSDPEVFAVVDDKLYLNINSKIQQRWERNQSRLIPRGDKAWGALAD